jgi:hypothetical protein
MVLALAAPALADQTFFCDDGTSVTLTSDNREAMQEHPCVKKWFTNHGEARAAKAAAAAEERLGRRAFAGASANKIALAPGRSERGSSTWHNVRIRINAGDDKASAGSQRTAAPRFRFRRR